MGYTTDFLGHLEVTPSFNDAEAEYLTAFAASRRCWRPGGPYEVPGNPRAEELPTEVSNRVATGQPGYWCDWVPCWDGCCISFTGHEKFYDPVAWLVYLRDHFLAPGAKAGGSGLPAFSDFTFNHQINGLVVMNRRDTREMSAIVVVDNAIEKVVMVPGVPEKFVWGPLPYEEEEDRWRNRSRKVEAERARRALDDIAALQGRASA